ncbi:MAG TPA: right-handed parallel beta-helix repeat-containing protein [Capsulimonadaceae bacterium]|jgi:hypothetical protein
MNRFATYVAAIAALSAPCHAGSLYSNDFNSPRTAASEPWAAEASDTSVKSSVSFGPVGTVDGEGSTTSSDGVQFQVTPAAKSARWTATAISGKFPVKTTETDQGKLTLGFMLLASEGRPVIVSIASLAADGKRSGGLETTIYPAAPNFYQRYSLDLSTMRPAGKGAFKPTDPFIRISFTVDSAAWTGNTVNLQIDNVSYASPAFYVSPTGSDTNDGRTEKTALADPQKAVDLAQPGDIILIADGTYHRGAKSSKQNGVIGFVRPGTPSAWIVVKNYPGQHPTLNSDGWHAIKFGIGTSQTRYTGPGIAYIEVRGMHVLGNALETKEKFPDDIGKALPSSNGNGISGDGRYDTHIPHHIRIADSIVEHCCGAGINFLQCDWTTVENNISRDNCWWMKYAGSGISFFTTANFDNVDNVYKDLIRNNVSSGNRCFTPWGVVKRISDGNGIIIDSNWEPAKNEAHLGRTLVQNNLTFNNGGSGIHSFHSHRVDIVNNTAYLNGVSPELNWGQIFVQMSDDTLIANNILVSKPGQPINTVGQWSGDQKSTNVVRSNNVYFGGIAPKLMGDKDVVADPLFVNPSADPAVADFHLKPGSPAIGAGTLGVLVPWLDLDGKPRVSTGRPDIGCYQK